MHLLTCLMLPTEFTCTCSVTANRMHLEGAWQALLPASTEQHSGRYSCQTSTTGTLGLIDQLVVMLGSVRYGFGQAQLV